MKADPLARRFFGLAYALSWAVGALLYVTGGLQPPRRPCCSANGGFPPEGVREPC